MADFKIYKKHVIGRRGFSDDKLKEAEEEIKALFIDGWSIVNINSELVGTGLILAFLTK